MVAELVNVVTTVTTNFLEINQVSRAERAASHQSALRCRGWLSGVWGFELGTI
jgi:hypothetical protein